MTWVIKQGVAKVCRGDVADQVRVRAVHDGRSPRAYSSSPGMRGPIAKSKRCFANKKNKKKNTPVKPSATTQKSTKQRSRRSFTSNNIISLATARK